MPGVRRLPSGKLQGWYFDTAGRRRYWTSEDPTATKAGVRAIVARMEDEHRQVRLGYRLARTSADRHRARPFAELLDEHLAWGAAQGGIGGRPWCAKHTHQRQVYLAWWQQRLGLRTVGDLDGILAHAEAGLRELLAARSSLTANNYVAALRALCRWAEQRGYLIADPLRGMAPVATAAGTVRRALTPAEISALLAEVPPERGLMYRVALASGLRRHELQSLTRADLDVARGGLRLHAAWTKNRQDGFQPLPAALVAELANVPPGPLVRCTDHAAARLALDLRDAGIPQRTVAGKLYFHSLRVTYVTLLVESSVNVREVQALARHASPALTMGVYARVRDAGLRAAVERIGAVFLVRCAPPAHGDCNEARPDCGSDCAASA
jgi:integrase